MSENESEQKKESNRMKVTKILREKKIETEINEREKKRVALNDAEKKWREKPISMQRQVRLRE